MSDQRPIQVLLLEPYMGGSHKDFVRGIEHHSRHQIHPVTMTGEHKKWRLMGSAVPLSREAEQVEEDIDLILASSITDLTGFTALTNPRFAHTPKVMYMHENFLSDRFYDNATMGHFNYLSALAADRVLFSSQHHFDVYFEALPSFLSQLPDYQHAETVKEIRDKSSVLHPGIHLARLMAHRRTDRSGEHPVILWNQRWTEDKNPDAFFRTMNRLDDAGLEFDLILAGDNRHDKPDAFEKAWRRYGQRIIHFGYVNDEEKYGKLLHQADIVVSTAVHEYFCTAIMEAIYCGCHPVLPKRLTYPELIPDALKSPLLHAPTLYEEEDDLFAIMRGLLTRKTKVLPFNSLHNVAKPYDWSRRISSFDDVVESLISD